MPTQPGAGVWEPVVTYATSDVHQIYTTFTPTHRQVSRYRQTRGYSPRQSWCHILSCMPYPCPWHAGSLHPGLRTQRSTLRSLTLWGLTLLGPHTLPHTWPQLIMDQSLHDVLPMPHTHFLDRGPCHGGRHPASHDDRDFTGRSTSHTGTRLSHAE